jgi:hypothetical protein
MEILDISPIVTPAIDVWPGDAVLARDLAVDRRRREHRPVRDPTSLHLGHTDAPSPGKGAEGSANGR